MKSAEIIVGLHVGTSSVKLAVAQNFADKKLQIIGACSYPCQGIRKDVVVDLEEVEKSILNALEIIERITGVPIDKVFIDIGGMHLQSESSKGVVAVSRADGEVSPDDVKRALSAAQAISISPNREIVYVAPKSFTVDDQKRIKDPVGMNGVRLEADAMIITGSTPVSKNLTKCVFQAGLDVLGIMPTPLVSAKAILTKKQKELGVAAINIGAGTTSLAVYEGSELMHFAIIPVGAAHITNDIAIGLRTSVETAEKIKIEFGSALPAEIHRRDQIDISKIDPNEESIVSRKRVAEIIEARMQEIFFLVDKELKKIKCQRLLPAGAVLAGGGAKMPGAVDLAKEILKLPAQLGFPQDLGGIIDKVDDPSFAACVGLIMFAAEEKPRRERIFDNFTFFAEVFKKVKKWVKGFLP